MVQTAQEIVPQMRAAGADIVVALCLGGLDTTPWIAGMENAAIPLSGVDGIDVIVMGHTHDIFPNSARSISPSVNPIAGQLHGKPAVMAGFYGSHLGAVSLDLHRRTGHWNIAASHVELIPADTHSPQTPLQNQLTHDLKPMHNKVLATIRQPIAQTELTITSHFANVAPDKALELLANANREAIRKASFGTEWEHLPILSAASQFRAGGRGGPSHYIDIPVGPIALRDASAIYPFENRVYAVRRTGAQLENWLNTSARIFEKSHKAHKPRTCSGRILHLMILTAPNATADTHRHIQPTGIMIDGYAKFLVQF